VLLLFLRSKNNNKHGFPKAARAVCAALAVHRKESSALRLHASASLRKTTSLVKETRIPLFGFTYTNRSCLAAHRITATHKSSIY